MTLIIYTDRCVPCVYKHDFKLVKQFAKKNDYNVQVRRTAISKDWQREAKEVSDIELPYIYNPDTTASVRLQGVNEQELSRLL